jgi:hypothetical protein
MRILLLGEYSGYYTNLAIGFRKLGHDITLFSNGHGFMELKGGVPYPNYGSGLTGRVKRKLLWSWNTNRFSNYDVVFVASAEFVNESWEPWYWARIRANNRLVVYTVCGQKDSHVIRNYPHYRKNIFLHDHGSINTEYTSELHRWEFGFCDRLVGECDGIITVSPDYDISYDGVEKAKTCIPLPIDCDSIRFGKLPNSCKIHFLHGKQHRPFLKGTQSINRAFEELPSTMKEKITYSHLGGLPLDVYKAKIQEQHVVVDQCKTLSYGMNAIYGMTIGRIVMSGNEVEATERFRLPASPVLNITNDSSQIAEVVREILDMSPYEMAEKSRETRQYAEDYHNASHVASRYLEFIQSL